MRAAAVLEGGSTPAAPIRVHVPGVLNVVAQGTIVAPVGGGPPALLETIDVNLMVDLGVPGLPYRVARRASRLASKLDF